MQKLQQSEAAFVITMWMMFFLQNWVFFEERWVILSEAKLGKIITKWYITLRR